jgi:hypothetical protein
MKFLSVFSSFFFTEAIEGIFVCSLIRDWHVGEAGCKTLKDLLLSLFNKEKLHVTTNSIVCSLINSYKIAPLF